MAKEIERKFLVTDSSYRELAKDSILMEQGYILASPEVTVRVRRAGSRAFITVKGPSEGFSRDEWEYSIPVEDASEMLERVASGIIISKTRYIVPWEGFTWEVDEFHGIHDGLVVAEIELPSADTVFPLPPFAGREVTRNHSYSNSSLAAGKFPNP